MMYLILLIEADNYSQIMVHFLGPKMAAIHLYVSIVFRENRVKFAVQNLALVKTNKDIQQHIMNMNR